MLCRPGLSLNVVSFQMCFSGIVFQFVIEYFFSYLRSKRSDRRGHAGLVESSLSYFEIRTQNQTQHVLSKVECSYACEDADSGLLLHASPLLLTGQLTLTRACHGLEA